MGITKWFTGNRGIQLFGDNQNLFGSGLSGLGRINLTVCRPSDLMEHLLKNSTRQLFEPVERSTKKRVIVYTLNGFLEQIKCN